MGRSRSRDYRHSRRRRRSTPSVSSDSSHEKRRKHRKRHQFQEVEVETLRSYCQPPAPYTIPDSAPRVQVPSNLPVEVTSFIDLFAWFVSRGGPTLEEEVRSRERNNPYFGFLSAPWNDPMNVYYRWRLYSLLQEGERQFMRWSTEPYQLERGEEAVVWIPPPVVENGIDHFRHLCAVLGRQDFSASSDVSMASRLVEIQQPSALWMSPLMTLDEMFFVALKAAEVAEWTTLLRTEDQMAEALQADMLSPEARVAAVVDFRDHILSADRIGVQMCFAVHHREAGVHCVSLVVDEMVKHAALVVAICEGPARWSEADPLEIACRLVALTSLLFLLHDVARNADAVALTDSELNALLDEEEQQQALKSETSISNNGGGSSSSVSGSTSKTKTTGLESLLSTLVKPPPPPPQVSLPRGHRNPLARALEWSIPTVLEMVIRVAIACCGSSGAVGAEHGLEVTREGPLADASLAVDGSSTLSTVTVALSAPLPVTSAALRGAAGDEALARQQLRWSAEVRVLALELLSWTKSLVTEWGDAGLIGTRCWLKLQCTYGFLLCHPVEETGV